MICFATEQGKNSSAQFVSSVCITTEDGEAEETPRRKEGQCNSSSPWEHRANKLYTGEKEKPGVSPAGFIAQQVQHCTMVHQCLSCSPFWLPYWKQKYPRSLWVGSVMLWRNNAIRHSIQSSFTRNQQDFSSSCTGKRSNCLNPWLQPC